MKHFTLGRLILVGITIQLFAVATANAQTSAGGLFRPWEKGKDYDFSLSGIVQDTASTSVGNQDVQLNEVIAVGRVRLSEEHELNPTIGFAVDQLELNSDSPLVPNQLSDQSIGFGSPIMKFNNNWFMAASAAVGYAGASPYGVGTGWYGKATLIVGEKFDNGDLLVFGLDYDGNRSFMPDTPLPGFAYSHRIDEKLLLAVGFPYTSIEWDPIKDLEFDLYFNLPDVFIARLSYNFIKPLGVYAGYEDRIQPFHVDDLPNSSDRLFYSSHRIEGGIRIDPADQITIRVALGWTFGQELNTGWDSREQDNVTDLSDVMYGRIAIESRF